MNWEPNRGLQARIAVVIGFLLVAQMVFMPVLGYTLANILTAFVNYRVLRADSLGETIVNSPAVVQLTAVVAVFGLGAQFLIGRELAVRSVGAEPVSEAAYPKLDDRLARLAQQADVPTPQLAVSQWSVPISFATGISQEQSTIVVSRGLVKTLNESQLDAVLAHEIAHIKNRDAAVMSAAYVLPRLASSLATEVYQVLNELLPVLVTIPYDVLDRVGAFISELDDERWGIVVGVLTMGLLLVYLYVASMVVLLLLAAGVISGLFWFVGFLLLRLLSRERERAADRAAAQITGDPLALATALERIDGKQSSVPTRDLRNLNTAANALYISPIEEWAVDSDDVLIDPDVFPNPHPPTEERVKRLKRLYERQETG